MLENDSLLTTLVKNKSFPPHMGLKTHWLLKWIEPKCFQYLLQKMYETPEQEISAKEGGKGLAFSTLAIG